MEDVPLQKANTVMSSLSIKKAFTFTGHEGSVYALEMSGESGVFFSGSSDRIVSQWSLDGSVPPKGLVNVGAIIYSLRFVREMNQLLIGTSAGNLHVIDLTAGKEIRNIEHHRQGIFDIQYDNANNRIYTAGADGTIALWRLDDISLLRSITLCKEKVRAIAVHPSSGEIAAACGDGSIRILDAANGTARKEFSAHGLSANAVIYDASGKRLLSGGRDAHLNVWDTESYERIQSIPAHNYAIYAFAFSPDQKILASASRDKTVKLWQADSLEIIQRIDREKHDGHRNSVNKVIWLDHPSGLVSTGDDRAIMAWKVR